MHLQRHQTIDAAGFDQGRHVAGYRWILGLAATILAPVAEIRRYHLHLASAGILERAAKKQQAAQLVVGALPAIPIQGVEHHDLATVDRFERSAFMLAIFVVALLMKRQRAAKSLRDSGCVVLTALQSKKKRAMAEHGLAPLRRIERTSPGWLA